MADALLRDATAPPVEGGLSLVDGGPFFRLLRGTGLSGRNLEGLPRRIAVLVALTWLPLLLLAAYEGNAWHGTAVPMLRDVDIHARFLVALPLLLYAEVVLHRRLPVSLGKFLERDLVPLHQRDEFDRILASARAWVCTSWVEPLLLVLTFAVGILGVWRHVSALAIDSWYVAVSDGVREPRLAGWWLLLVGLPLFQFLMLRWYFRLAVWWRLLWRISRLRLSLQPLHPDHAAGLGFLGQLTSAYAPLVMAQGALASGWIANQILFAHARLPQYKLDLLAAAVVVIFLVVGPLLFFMPQLVQVRRAGLGRLGALAARYVNDFESKWLAGGAGPGEPLVGSADIQSLADLGNSYQSMKETRLVPFNTSTVIPLAAAMAAPLVPLTLTMFSVEELVARLVDFLL
jgi:hypothetical protein